MEITPSLSMFQPEEFFKACDGLFLEVLSILMLIGCALAHMMKNSLVSLKLWKP